MYEKIADFGCCIYIELWGICTGENGKKDGQKHGSQDGNEERLCDDGRWKNDGDERR